MTAAGGRAGDTISAMAAAAAHRFGDRLAIVDGDRRISHAELFDEARSFAGALVASGIEAGDRVAIWAPNSREWVVALLGLLQAGATLVPINTRFKGGEAAEILARSGARALVTVTDFLGVDHLDMLRRSGIDLPAVETVVVAGPAPDDAEPWHRFLGRADHAAGTEVDRRRAALEAGTPSDLLFTSGTTGAPKGVMMTHGRTLRVAIDWVEMTGLGADDRYLMVNPYFHMFGLKAGILACLVSGAIMFPEPVFDVDRALRRVAEERITVFPGAPTIYQSILDHPARDRLDLSSLRVAVTGAADIPVQLIRRMDAELPFSTIITGYGLTEAGTVTATSPSDDPETIATTVGQARPGYELRIVGPDLADVPAGEPGEVVVRSPTVMVGYLDDPGATAEALSDGWLRTGDIGVLDAERRLRIVGRSKDMFIVGGFNAYPAEIENTLLRHPDVQRAAVIGIPDTRLGAVGMAFVVSRSSDDGVGPAILSWCREQMANYKVPRVIEIVPELPVNATGKVVKDELRARVAHRVPQ